MLTNADLLNHVKVKVSLTKENWTAQMLLMETSSQLRLLDLKKIKTKQK